MSRNRSICQKTEWAAEQMAALQRGFTFYLSLSHMSEPMGLKRDRNIEEKSAWPDLRPLKFSVKRINRNCALSDGCADFCDGAVTIC